EAGEDLRERRPQLGLPRHHFGAVLQRRKRQVDAVDEILPARARRPGQRARRAAASERSSSTLAASRSGAGRTSASELHSDASDDPAKSAASASHSESLFAIDNSMLIRSMPSV